MDNRTRNRLIGIIAILLIIIIFFPYMGKKSVFEKEKEIALTALSAEYGESPDEATKPSKPPKPHTTSRPSSETLLPATSAVISPKPAVSEKLASQNKPVLKTPRVESEKSDMKRHLNDVKNYAIQLVALKNQKKIEELLALLRLHNYHAYVDKRDEEHIQRLFIGPYSSKEQAESTILDLHNLTKLKGIIITK